MPNKGDTDDIKVLSELGATDRRINVIAVAYSFSAATPTKGTRAGTLNTPPSSTRSRYKFEGFAGARPRPRLRKMAGILTC